MVDSEEQSTAPSMPRIGVQQVKDTREMLLGFRDAIKGASFNGKDSRWVAMGLEFLENMIRQSERDLVNAKRQEQEMKDRAKEAIKAAGGSFKAGGSDVGSQTENTAA